MELDEIRVQADGEEERYETAEEFEQDDDYIKGLETASDEFEIAVEFDERDYSMESVNNAKGLLSDYQDMTDEPAARLAADQQGDEEYEETQEDIEEERDRLEKEVQVLRNQLEQYKSDEVNRASIDELVEDESTETGYAAWIEPESQAKEAYKVPLGEEMYQRLAEGAEVEVDAHGGAIRGVYAMPDETATGYELMESEVPDIDYDDIVGLDEQIETLRRKTVLEEQHPGLFEEWDIDKSMGAVLYGPPGTGKTMTVKAMANEEDRNLIKVDGPELMGPLVGESPERVREIFDKAREAAPSLIMVDELDALAQDRQQIDDNTGAGSRMVGQLLAELDGIKESADVDFVGTTNQPDLLDDALLRPGRLDPVEVPQPDREASKELAIANGAPEVYADRMVETIFSEEEYQEVNSGARIEAVVKETVMDYALEELEPGEELPSPGQDVAEEIDWGRFEETLDEVYQVEDDELEDRAGRIGFQ